VATNPRYANGHRRRQLRARVLATETYCGWERCEWPDEPIDKALPPDHPLAPEVDEIIPVSMGGDPLARSNVRLLHRICNQRRGNGTRTPKRIPKPAAFPTSRAW
jgi:5-methylcytosine-specific restriction endonuclease McrA